MKGIILTLPVMDEITWKKVDHPNILKEIQEAVGGHIEAVPYFNKFTWRSKKRDCVAFCNEEGKLKGLPMNRRATLAWCEALKMIPADVLVGNIAIVMGDDEFMQAI